MFLSIAARIGPWPLKAPFAPERTRCLVIWIAERVSVRAVPIIEWWAAMREAFPVCTYLGMAMQAIKRAVADLIAARER